MAWRFRHHVNHDFSLKLTYLVLAIPYSRGSRITAFKELLEDQKSKNKMKYFRNKSDEYNFENLFF